MTQTRDEVPAVCPHCGQNRMTISVVLNEELQLRDEFELTAMNREGCIVAERSEKQDAQTKANLSTDAGHPAQMAVLRLGRLSGFVEEENAAVALAQSLNKLRGTQYAVEKKDREDSDYADRIMVSTKDTPLRIIVQMCHLDADIAQTIGRVGTFTGFRSAPELVAHIKKAIDRKALVDMELKSKTILLLITPAVLGQIMRQDLKREEFDRSGFMEVWLTSFREDAFALC